MSAFIEILIGGVVGGLVGGGMAIFGSRLEHRWNHEARKRQLSESLAGQLDTFAIACAKSIAEDATSRAKQLMVTSIPEMQNQLLESDLSLLNVSIAAEIHELRANHNLAQSVYKFFFSEEGDVAGADDFASLECGVLGISALTISKKIRRDCGLKQPNYQRASWKFIEVLEKEKLRHEARLKKENDLSEANK